MIITDTSKKVLDNTPQPSFTTRPSWKGMGLGLSLSYEIIQAHGGEIKVETKIGMNLLFCYQ